MNPFLSIIIPLFNKQDCILKTIDSVLSQDCSDYEIVIVDDGSSDNSVKVVENVGDERIQLYRKENGGPSSARNYGVARAKGEWVLFLDADDTLEDGALMVVRNDIRKHLFADIICYNLFSVHNSQKSLSINKHKRGYLFLPFLHWYNGSIFPRTGNMVCKRSVIIKVPYCEKYRRWEDGDNTFRLMERYRFYANPTPLFTYNCDYLEASKPLKNLSEDFSCNLNPHGKPIFEKLALYKLYQEFCFLYPEYVEQLYGDTFKDPLILRTIRLLNHIEKINRKTKKLKITIKSILSSKLRL